MGELQDPQAVREALLSGEMIYPEEIWEDEGRRFRVADPRRVRSARRIRALSMRQLGERIGCSQSAVARIEHGGRTLTGADLVVVAVALSVPVSDLLYDADETTPASAS